MQETVLSMTILKSTNYLKTDVKKSTQPHVKYYYDKIQDILVEEAPMIFMQHQAYLTGVSDEIEGYWIDTSGYYKLQNVKFKK